jgi:hypothetical protein
LSPDIEHRFIKVKPTLSVSASSKESNIQLKNPDDWVLKGQTIILNIVLSPNQFGLVGLYIIQPRPAGLPENVIERLPPIINVEMRAGVSTYQYKPSSFGTYQFFCKWLGDNQTEPAQSNSISVKVLLTAPKPTLILRPSKYLVATNEQFTLNGTLSEPKSAFVGLYYKPPGATSFTHLKKLDVINGIFNYNYSIGVNGQAQFRAEFNSDRIRLGSTNSGDIPVVVGPKIKPTTVLSINVTLGYTADADFTLSGTLSTPKTSNQLKWSDPIPPHYVPPVQVFVHHKDDPDGYPSGWHRAIFNGLLDCGVFMVKSRSKRYCPNNLLLTDNGNGVFGDDPGYAPKGIYEIKVYWPGDETTEEAWSNIVTFETEKDYGSKHQEPASLLDQFIDFLTFW